METTKTYYFSGIGGSGMSPLAQVLRQRGHRVCGSDRSYDRRQNMRLFGKLRQQGICLLAQDGPSLPGDIDCLVVSTAIEKDSMEISCARQRGIPVVHRAGLLSELFNAKQGVGIAGTSGKSTVTGMVASILDAAGKDPTVVNGGIIKQYVSRKLIGNARGGGGAYLAAEIDESDGSIIHFHPHAALINNIARDHKEIEELQGLFQTFIDQTAGPVILNGDCPAAMSLRAARAITFGLDGGHDITARSVALREGGSQFTVRDVNFSLFLPGIHNVGNALGAIAVGMALEVPLPVIQKGLARFRGIRRRLDVVGRKHGVCVVDDFAHNPDKIAASLKALKPMGRRLLIVFQPHGYGPTRFMLRQLAEAFSMGMDASDALLLLKIYDAGGTADRTISSCDLLDKVKGPLCLYTPERSEAIAALKEAVRPGDVIAVMGARDDTLTAFARKILRAM